MSPRIWSHPVLPLEFPIRVEAGMPLELALILSLRGNTDGVWKWSLAVDEQIIEQSNFGAIPLNRKMKRLTGKPRAPKRRAESEIARRENHGALDEQQGAARD